MATRLHWLLLGIIVLLLLLAVVALEAMQPTSYSFKKDRVAQSEQPGLPDETDLEPPKPTETPPGDSAYAHAEVAVDSTVAFSTALAEELFFLQGFPLEGVTSTVYDYSDPTADGLIPLITVYGREDDYLSPNFTVGDLAARDGAPYARISPKLVNTLEYLTALAEAPIYVSSGYRHPVLNADPAVGGAARSQHLAGQAADIWSHTKTPGELVELALAITRCNVGVGLGGTFIHLDVRGHLASWVYADAEMDEATFDAWVRARCSTDPQPPSFTDAARMAARRSEMTALVLEDTLITRYRAAMGAFAQTQAQERGKGAVLLDLRRNSTDPDGAPANRLSYVLPGSDTARQWNLDALIRSVPVESHFAYAIIGSDGHATIGAMSYALAVAPDR